MRPSSSQPSDSGVLSLRHALRMLWISGLMLVLPAGSAVAEEWSQWRGPDRNGHATMLELPGSWPEVPTRQWQVEVGEGYGSPVVWGDRVFLITRQGENEVAMALDVESGRAVWKKAFPTPYTMHSAATNFGKSPRSTPVVADGKVCFLGIDARLTCHDATTGKILWTKDYSDRSSHERNFCGSSLTPIVEDGVLYAHLGDDTGGTLFAADLATGKEKWTWSGQGPSYTSPMLFNIGGIRQLVTLGAVDILGFHAATGELLWRRPFPDEWNQNIVTPLQIGERLIFADVENGSLGAWPKKSPDTGHKTPWTLEELWADAELTQYMASPVTDGRYVYGFTNRHKGRLFVLDPSDGQVLWHDEGRGGRNASLTLAGPWLLVSNTDSELKIYRRKGSGLEKTATYEIADSPVWAQPAWLKDGFLIKDASKLSRWSFAEAKSQKSSDEAP